ncbi:DUF1993 domain-containing protein [Cellvibrio japonicus]|uniref:DUF1993 domain-containing protein n=1 Tax=Cellvibrio japonicus (strain Ueda107) TaxID=498211 RepID=B3PH88_CELJU|nr:DUF1993 domain-containing protein [Cellvibrio japonicus]ACE83871.1 conserved hypothetical protein [Cellvibrio japonicus Ueda107]QEI11011.1 DUF1993 domain-containing protein [Cellvibrio japonicus]QEI14586.1 DUF1993 domain-containing protein [Cellvibrio japonicus]QEI18165.1 DUF1993 domain-containing protein [Cellvibrio japonicus]
MNPIPVFIRYLQQLQHMLRLMEAHTQGDCQLLGQQLHPHMLPLLAQVRTAANFAPRALCPLLGRERIGFENSDHSYAGLQQQLAETIQWLTQLPTEDITPACASISDKAGFQDLDLPAQEYLQQYALPNFFFHLGMAYAIARHAGVPLSKGDFDGYHQYPPGFSFV